jgi:outer membrane protein, multidrug efflux system
LPQLDYRDIFRDPALQNLIDRALANNQDVRIALANVASVRGQLGVQRAQLLPRIDGTAGVSVGESGAVASSGSAGGTGGGGRRTTYDINIGLTAFEIDLFGRVRSLNDAALQTYLASEAAVRATRLTLVAEVATAYLTLATDRSLLAIARETEGTAARSVALTQARLSGGVAPRSDLRQAETVLAQARSDVANLTTVVAQDRNALELLIGAPVADGDLAPSIESVDGSLAELPAGLESGILLRRPDVLQAEYQLRAANARIGAARAAFFPSIGLTAVAGLASSALSSLFTSGAFAWSVGPSVSVPLFDAGANRGNLDDIAARRDAAVGQYQKTIQTAFREVADALARRGTIGSQYEAQAQLEAAARDSFALADARYREGVDPFLNSLDAQRTLYSARRSLASTRLLRANNLVELYRALGGGTGE